MPHKKQKLTNPKLITAALGANAPLALHGLPTMPTRQTLGLRLLLKNRHRGRHPSQKTGKLPAGPAPGPSPRTQPRGYQVCPPTTDPSADSPLTGISSLCRATPGSAGLDLCAAADSVLIPDHGIQLVPTTTVGPMPPGTFGLILGRES